MRHEQCNSGLLVSWFVGHLTLLLFLEGGATQRAHQGGAGQRKGKATQGRAK